LRITASRPASSDLCGEFRKFGIHRRLGLGIIAAKRAQDRRIGYNVADGGDGIGSGGAIAVHRRPQFREALLASMPIRHAKAQATKNAGGINQLAAVKAAATKRARGINKRAGTKAAATKAARLAREGNRSGG
jgi:hypothetical protein